MIAKRVFDLIVSFFALIITLPVIAIFSLIAGISSPGGPFYVQKRVGLNGRMFNIYKIRSMFIGDEQKPAMPNDSRVTPIGRFIRRTKIDELPQLLNVLKGDMSLVGPRPKRLTLFNSIPDELKRQITVVRPGLTGPAQLIKLTLDEGYLHHNSDNLFHLQCEIEASYFKWRSLTKDFYICLKTIQIIVFAKIYTNNGRLGSYEWTCKNLFGNMGELSRFVSGD